MNIFKSAARIALSHPVYLVAYLAVMTFMGVMVGQLVQDSANQSTGAYRPAGASVLIVDHDGSAFSRGLEAWARGRFDVLDSDADPQDALARGLADCVLVVPRGYGEQVLDAARADGADDLPQLEAAYGTNVQAGVLAAQEAAGWVSLAGRAAALEPDAAEARVAALASAAAAERVAPALVDTEASAAPTAGAVTYFTFAAYPIFSAVVVTVGLVLSAFTEPQVRRRAGCAPVSLARQNLSLMGACLVLALAVWAVNTAVGMAVFAEGLAGVPTVQLALVAVVQLAISLTPLALAFLLSQLGLREQGLNAAGNIGGMVLTFLGGAWVPLDFMSPTVQTVAKFVPTYWSCDAITVLLESPALTGDLLVRVGVDAGITVLFAVAIAAVGLALGKARRA